MASDRDEDGGDTVVAQGRESAQLLLAVEVVDDQQVVGLADYVAETREVSEDAPRVVARGKARRQRDDLHVATAGPRPEAREKLRERRRRAPPRSA